eukprot:COSAG05_NODE_269_length_12494_cov_9.329326_3_plen_551_part_00
MLARPPRKVYDFVVVGSGPSAASWVRSALREAPTSKILLLERGPYCKTDLLTERNPLKLLRDSKRVVKDYQHGVVQGHTLGGGSAVNNYAWITPSWADFTRCLGLDISDSRTAMADYENMVEELIGKRPPPHMLQKLLTKDLDPDVELVNNGAIRVRASNRNKVFLGSPTLNPQGIRRSAFSAVIEPLWREHFSQLDVVSDTEAAQVLFRPPDVPGGDPVATGVQARSGEVWHADNIVVASGALESPALLMRSGIGPEAHLKERGVAPGILVANEHVGQHLRDKMLVDDMLLTDTTLGDFDQSLLIVNRIFAGDGASVQLHRYDKSTVGNTYLALTRLLTGARQNNNLNSYSTALRNAAKFLHPAGYNALCFQTYFKMESEANVTLSANGRQDATLDASALFAEAHTREAALRTRLQEIYAEIFGMRDSARLQYNSTLPGVTEPHATQEAGALARHLRLVWHFAGTCRMGDVVRSRDFGVHGVRGLHVVDMSACRVASDGGTMGMAYLTGHMAAHRMLQSQHVTSRQLQWDGMFEVAEEKPLLGKVNVYL